MKIKKAFKFRLRPTPEQSQKMYEFAGCTRFVWNKALGLNLARLSQKHPILYYQELDFWSKIWVTTHPSDLGNYSPVIASVCEAIQSSKG